MVNPKIEEPTLNNPFSTTEEAPLDSAGTEGTFPGSPNSNKSKEGDHWDASKTLPSAYGKRKGSIYATPASRDGHTDSGKARDKSFHDKLKEKGWLKFGKSSS